MLAVRYTCLKLRALMRPRCCGGFPQVISFLRKKAEFIDLVLKHLETSAMMDLLLRLVSCVEPAPLRQEVLQVTAAPLLSLRLTLWLGQGTGACVGRLPPLKRPGSCSVPWQAWVGRVVGDLPLWHSGGRRTPRGLDWGGKPFFSCCGSRLELLWSV